MVPVLGVEAAEIQDDFGAPRPDGRVHRGIDIDAPVGAPIIAAFDGWIWHVGGNSLGGRTLYLLDTTGRFVVYYAHLSAYAERVEPGRPVRRGEVVGYVGETGSAEGHPHLHFRLGRVDDPDRYWENEPLNPHPLLTEPGPVVARSR